MGEEGQQDPAAFRRNETPRHDRQGAGGTEPKILFLDEPTAGVDVELRKDMWNLVRRLREDGVTIHPHHPLYRGSRGDRRPCGLINKGRLIIVEERPS